MAHYFRQAIEETLPWLSSFGADPTGGITRLLYSPEWLQAQQAFKQRMSESGLETRFDEVGNLMAACPVRAFPTKLSLAVRILIAWSTAVILTASSARWRPGWRYAG
ncbi:allantoate amidohydrolase [Klebsiella grimontii]|uniref:Allantoate amidohydrolase n=1 Tax=Klebsiella grimontii TaxID=2058152 RepID=A0A7H4P8M6_9ENTR|nr:allantoate amidohydrolase [Klebsiella grimontii]